LSTDDVTNDVTTSPLSLQSGDLTNLVFKIISSIIGIVGIVDNLFVIVVFSSFIRITEKVFYSYVLVQVRHYRSITKNPAVARIANRTGC